MPKRTRCLCPLSCPICRAPLQLEATSLQCPQRHSFDIAREGYVNLLPSRKRLGPTVGDSTEMLQARRRFLESGAYTPLATAINELIMANLKRMGPTAVLDAGCGEGHYLGRLARSLETNNGAPVCLLGMDVAKTAVRMAAKRYRDIQFFVADVHRHIPCEDSSLDLILNVFAPRHPQEFARVLRPNGQLLVVIPTPAHLGELRRDFDLLNIEPEKEGRLTTHMQPDFTLISGQTLQFPLTLSGQQLQDLVQMTPNARHLTSAKLEQMAAAKTMTTAASVRLLLFHRNHSNKSTDSFPTALRPAGQTDRKGPYWG